MTLDGVEKVLNDLAGPASNTSSATRRPALKRRADGAVLRRRSADRHQSEVSSVRDSDRILGILSSKSKRAEESREPVKEHLLITRYSAGRVDKGEMLSVDDVKEILRVPLLGVIPESQTVLQTSTGTPAIHLKGSDVADAYSDVVARFLGEERPMRFLDAPKWAF